jgi:hypothetical protein
MAHEANVHEIPHHLEATEHDTFAENDHAFTGFEDSTEAKAYAYGTEGTPGSAPNTQSEISTSTTQNEGPANEDLKNTEELRVARAAGNFTLKKGDVSLQIGGGIERDRV